MISTSNSIKIASFIFFLLLNLFANAQVQIGSAEIPALNSAGKLTAESLIDFKKTTTLFTLQTKDYDQKELFQEVLKKLWTVTPFQIITPDEISTYLKENNQYSFATFDGFAVQTRNGTNTHISYDFWMPEYKNGKFKRQKLFARIALHCDFNTYQESNKLFLGKRENGKFINYLYTTAILINGQAGMLTSYIKIINDGISSGTTRGMFSGINNNDALQSLKTDTLFLPEYIKTRFNMFNGNETVDEDNDEEDVKKVYPYPYKYIATDELNLKILTATKPINYLVYIKSSTDKYISVYNSDGLEMYSNYTPLSYNFKSKDLKKLASFIKKD